MTRLSFALVGALLFLGSSSVVRAQTSPAFTAEELEAIYTTTIDKRTRGITELLAISDETKSNTVHLIIMSQYRALRARDAAVDTMFQSLSPDIPGVESNRAAVVQLLSKPLHAEYLAKLAVQLSPAQIEIVKDRMTYGKVKVTYDAYCEIIPGLTDKEKAMILDTLKAAREEAMDGGSADEKSAIFQKYKNKINASLSTSGYDVVKATQEWEAKRAASTPPAN